MWRRSIIGVASRRSSGYPSYSALVKNGKVNHKTQSKETYSTTSTLSSEASVATNEEEEDAPKYPQYTKKELRQIATVYNNNRAAYNRSVSHLRKKYFAESQKLRERDNLIASTRRAKLTRRRLERQHEKNIQSVQNAIIDTEKKNHRARVHAREVKEAQERVKQREEKYFRKARQLVLDELEAECHLWLMDRKEVDRALGHENVDQMLWVHPGSVVGAPRVTEDQKFWGLHCHTWHMDGTLPAPREVFMEELEDAIYWDSNMDSNYWNEENHKRWEERKERAQLRALVRRAGRLSLLKKQREQMQSDFDKKGMEQERFLKMKDMEEQGKFGKNRRKGKPFPKSVMPPPTLDLLEDYQAHEEEGVRILMADPAQFFKFENVDGESAQTPPPDTATSLTTPNQEESDQPTLKASMQNVEILGKVIGLRDPLRDGQGETKTPFPSFIGVGPFSLPTQRTEKEREKIKAEKLKKFRAMLEEKKKERQQKKKSSNPDDDDFDFDDDEKFQTSIEDAEEEFEFMSDTPSPFYVSKEDFLARYEEKSTWKDGLDPIEDADLIDTPIDQRFTDKDREWMISHLKDRAKMVESMMHDKEEQVRSELFGEDEEAQQEIARKKTSVFENFDKVMAETSKATAAATAKYQLSNNQQSSSSLDQSTSYHSLLKQQVQSGEVDLDEAAAFSQGLQTLVPKDDIDTLAENITKFHQTIGHDMSSEITSTFGSLSPEQLSAIEGMIGQHPEWSEDYSAWSAERVEEVLAQIPGIKEDQLKALVDLEMRLGENEEVKRMLKTVAAQDKKAKKKKKKKST